MNELPVDLAPPLHFMEPGGFSAWWLLFPLLALLLSRWLRGRRSPVPTSSTTPLREAPKVQPTGLAEEIDALREQYKGKSDYRRGCHELAWLLRQHVVGTMALTAHEIAATLSTAGISKVFPLLAALQFRRKEPRRSDFTGICELAQKATRHGATEE
jgi:hypothetical protein